MTSSPKPNPLDELLRARLRIPEGAGLRLVALRRLLGSVDGLSRGLSGQPFFALREAEEILRALEGRTGHALLEAVMQMNGGTTIRAHGLDNVPPSGPVVIASTHPIGTFDFLAHADALLQRRPDLKVVAGRETERFLGSDILIPVDLDKKDRVLTARQTRAGMIAHLKAGGALVIFGSGRVPRLEKGLLVEPDWRTGATRASTAAHAPIVPASPAMRNSKPYYRTRRLAAALSGGNDDFGRKVASLRYVSELTSKLGGTYDVHFGAPLPAGTAPAVLQEAAEALVPGLYRA